MFNELLKSVKEMDQIAKGKKKASREFTLKEPEVKNIRGKQASLKPILPG